MGIVRCVTFDITCDVCDADGEYTFGDTSDDGRLIYSTTDVIRDLRATGWSVGKRVICPECRTAVDR